MIKQLLLCFLLVHGTILAAGKGKGGHHKHPPRIEKWLTLNGAEPVVVARGGFSGTAPESSIIAYKLAQMSSLPSTVMLCDLQLTKDGEGFCQYTILLQNSTDIANVFPDKEKTYNVNGRDLKGWFGVDFVADELLKNVFLMQNIFSRSPNYDLSYNMLTPFDIVAMEGSPRLWINVQYPTFFDQRKLSPALYIEDTMKDLNPAYISSPEIGFLKSLGGKVNKATTKLIFRVLGIEEVEPTTKEKYGSLLQKLPTIKEFASGIIVPKAYIWPIDDARFLENATNLVYDAHKAGLEVFASEFSSDNVLSYNYSYDPTKEYLQFIDNGQFSVDGVITDFPSTASESIACFAHKGKPTRIMKTLIITHDGASGDYPGSSDLAYQKAIDDGADIIDCSLQMSKDGVAFCLPSIDLTGSTTASSLFLSRSTNIPEVQEADGIFSFDLTWSEIQSLKLQIISPFNGDLSRNPANKNKGKFVTLSEFLELAKQRAIPGVLINIKNAAYLASNKGLDVVGVVTSALSNATFDKQSAQKVLIQSDDSSVLLKFKDFKNYQRVLNIEREIGSATNEMAQEVKKYADAVRVFRNSVVLDYPNPVFMSLNYSNIVEVMHAANISVYVGALRNEFQNFLFDYNCDPYVEIATFTQNGVDGIITDFPATARAFVNTPCANPDADLPYTILPIKPGDLFMNMVVAKPPKGAPVLPPLQNIDVIDPALPPVAKVFDSGSNSTSTPGSNSTPSPTSAPKSSKSKKLAGKAGLTIAAMVGVLTILGAD